MARAALCVRPEELLALFRATDLDTLIDGAFQAVDAVVKCDHVSAIYRNDGTGLLKERDSRGREYAPEFMHRYAQLTPALPAVLSNRGIKILTTRRELPGPTLKLRRTAFYREIMRPQGWRHGVTLCFWGDRPAELPIPVVVAYRREGRPDFSAHDVTTLENLHPFIDCAVNRVHEREAAETVHDGMLVAARNRPQGYAILDHGLVPIQVDAMARQLCAAWINGGAGPQPADSPGALELPPALAVECRELHGEWHALVHTDPDAKSILRHRRIVHPRVAGLTASITMVSPSTTSLMEPTFVLELHRRVHGIPLDVIDESVPILRKLTTAERAVALVLADGLSNQEIADRLRKSVHAVKFLLHRIYNKIGVPNRAALVAVLRSRGNRARASTQAPRKAHGRLSQKP